jgi:hypothetical protein
MAPRFLSPTYFVDGYKNKYRRVSNRLGRKANAFKRNFIPYAYCLF